VSSQTLNKAIGNQGAFLVLGNLMLKFNEKTGGVNYGLCTSNSYRNRAKAGHDIV
jgi:hypothetical protein